MNVTARTVNLLFPLLLWLLVDVRVAGATEPDRYILKEGHMLCANEVIVMALADAKSPDELQRLITKAINAELCTSQDRPITNISSVVRKRTARGNSYYCFKELEMETSGPTDDLKFSEVEVDQVHCAIQSMVSTLDAELRSRRGDFTLVDTSPTFLMARCKEGGTVSIVKEDDRYYRSVWNLPWRNIAQYLPRVQVQGDLNEAMREGCKGSDVR